MTAKGEKLKISQRTNACFRATERGMVLLATRHGAQAPQFPPREFAHGNELDEELELGPAGTLYTYSIVHATKDQPPYAVAIVDFHPGVRAFGRLLVDGAAPALGTPVRVVPFDLPDGTPDYAFQAG